MRSDGDDVKLYALSDLHVGYEHNRQALQELAAHPDDWLILAGDLGESAAHLEAVFDVACTRFAKVFWVPGNHELWTQSEPTALRGVEKYESLVAVCRARGVVTPEDPYVLWTGPGGPCLIACLFCGYDYSYRPAGVSIEQAVDWATEAGILSADEVHLDPHPYPTRQDWCAARVRDTEVRLAAAAREHETVLVSHFPLRRELVRIPYIPQFVIWCGSLATDEWHKRFRAKVVVSGHLHVRTTDYVDGVRFEEVSLGYPRQWRSTTGVNGYLREILPGEPEPDFERGRYWP